MKIIKCTQKLLKELSVEQEEDVIAQSWIESWHANIFRINSRKCILVSNDATLYSLVFYPVNKSFIKKFQFYFNEHLFKTMLADNIPQALIEKVLAIGDEIIFTKTDDRRVLGSMNDFKQHIEALADMHNGLKNCSIFNIQKMLNTMPMRMLEYQTPIKAFMQKLENG